MEKAEAELKEHNDKIKVWLDQEIKFDFEEFKRVYCNAQPGEFPQVFEWLWKNWNDSEVSFFYLRYQKLKNELTGEIKSMNTQQAFIDRTDSKSSRFGFGIQNMWWSEDEKEYEMRGLYLFKGTELPYSFKCHQLLEYHDIVKLDVSKAEDKELIET